MAEPTGIIPAILISALIQVESSGDPRAHNKAEDAVGILQIRKILVDDLNRIGPPYYTYKDRWDARKSKEMAQRYLGYYIHPARLGRAPTLEDYARTWNGGPNGWRKTRKRATDGYWKKVQTEIVRLENQQGEK